MWFIIIVIVLTYVGYFCYKNGVFSDDSDMVLSESSLQIYSEIMGYINRWQAGKDKFPTDIFSVRVETFTDFPNYTRLETYIYLDVHDSRDIYDVKNEYRNHPSYSKSDRESLQYFFDVFEKSNLVFTYEGCWQSVFSVFEYWSNEKNKTQRMAKSLVKQLEQYNQQHFPNMNIEVDEDLLCLK